MANLQEPPPEPLVRGLPQGPPVRLLEPPLVLADEPTGNLDSINAKEIIDLMIKINSFGTTVVLVTHNRDVVNKLKRRVLTLHEGRLVSDQAIGKYLI